MFFNLAHAFTLITAHTYSLHYAHVHTLQLHVLDYVGIIVHCVDAWVPCMSQLFLLFVFLNYFLRLCDCVYILKEKKNHTNNLSFSQSKPTAPFLFQCRGRDNRGAPPLF